jgi:hypothetical protein
LHIAVAICALNVGHGIAHRKHPSRVAHLFYSLQFSHSLVARYAST